MPFKALGLCQPLVQAAREMHYTEPTPIQTQAIPAILSGRDLIATAQTGTGKTAAFLLPILHRLMERPRNVTGAVVVSPTRELAHQIETVCRSIAYRTQLRVALLVGGVSMYPQEKALRSGVEIIVATPGRLLDHMMQNQGRFGQLHTVVLDEADQMLDMGFLVDIRRIIARMPARKQTLLFSATMPPVIVQLSKEILRNPNMIQIGKRSTPAIGITQAAYPVPEHLKVSLLRHLLRQSEMPSVLVFTRTKRSAKRLASAIATDGFAVDELHGNLSQSQRTRAMDGFRKRQVQILVATNIAARGLDVNHITHVISFDVPNTPDDYIHRIGRTARAAAEGDAFILVAPEEERSLAQIERQIGQRLPRVTLPEFDYRQSEPQRGPKSERNGKSQRSSSSKAGRSSSPHPASRSASAHPSSRPAARRGHPQR